MVLDPPKKPVDVLTMVVLSFIPIVSIWVAWRIQKFWLILLIEIGISIIFSIVIIPVAFFNSDLAWIVGLIWSVGASVILVYYFAQKYNEKVSGITKSSGQNERITDYVEQNTKKKFFDQETVGTSFIVTAIGVAGIIAFIVVDHYANLMFWK